ncbi:hypothetical protein G8E10_24795 [Rhizobiaceae bacterium CRRU44]|uniref:Uncharacterized protein n=1 Tax=Ferranicluibacter rubi TaxID=2715133 RepID=A0AA44CER6_9HYPH|nr:hypothetical protein [Ferranicluibacter rubi]NHT78921.1 hypothetical protein [Ferranicluibacter rubi]
MPTKQGFFVVKNRKKAPMAALNTKPLRVQIDARLVDGLDDLAKVRSVLAGKKITPAEIVAEALRAHFDIVPRLEQVGNVADLINRIGKLEANLSDQVERGFAALAEVEELKAENQMLNAAALYSHSFDSAE